MKTNPSQISTKPILKIQFYLTDGSVHSSHLDQPALMAKREQQTPVGDLLVSFVKLQMRGGRPLFVMVEIPVKLPAESQLRYLWPFGLRRPNN